MSIWKRAALLALAAVLVFSLSSCGKEGESALTQVTLCLDWTPNTNHTGFYVAQAMGWFEEAGLSVRIVQPTEDGATVSCAAGQVEFAITAQDTLAAAFAREKPLAVTAVATLLQHNTSGILGRAGEGLDTPAGLEGKRYSTWNSPIELAMLEHVVEEGGGDFASVTLIPNNIVDEAGALRENQTDAVWVFYGWSGISAELSGLDFDYFAFGDMAPVLDYYTPVLIASDKFLAEKPETAKAFLAAAARGYEYAIAHPEEAARLLIEGDDTGALRDSEGLVLASQEWMTGQYKAEVERWGYIDPARWDAFYQWLNDNALVERPIPEGTGFSNEYLP